jgi:hypothetical protein
MAPHIIHENRRQGLNQEPQDAKKISRKLKISRKAMVILLIVVLFWPVLYLAYYGAYSVYTSIDRTEFPQVHPAVVKAVKEVGPTGSSDRKGAVLLTAIQSQLERELDSTFGWTVNDLFFMPTAWLDNRLHRQQGVIFATRMLLRFYSLHLAKLGPASEESPLLKEVREKRIVYSEDIWGFFRPSAESEYGKAIDLLNRYKENLAQGEAVYNARTDDLYNILNYITGEELLGQPMGLLVQPDKKVPFTRLDDNIYYTQGVVLVVRDFLYALDELYPIISEKGGAEQMVVARNNMNLICTYDPLIVLRGEGDSLLADHNSKLARYMLVVTRRVEDVAESIRR